jgi:hypothetical protein
MDDMTFDDFDDFDDIDDFDGCVICQIAATCDAWCAWLCDHPGRFDGDVQVETARRRYNGQTISLAGVDKVDSR